MGKPREFLCGSGGAAVRALRLLIGTGALVASTCFGSPTLGAQDCDAATLESVQRRFAELPVTAALQRDELLLQVARCRYREERWREFFALARYRRAFGAPTSEASESLALLDVLASLRHCRADRARDVFSQLDAKGTSTLRADRQRIELALGALTQDPASPPKPTEKSTLERGLGNTTMHWPVTFEDERLRQSDPFRLQVRVASRCQVAKPEVAP